MGCLERGQALDFVLHFQLELQERKLLIMKPGDFQQSNVL